MSASTSHGEGHKKDNKGESTRVYDRCVSDSLLKAGVGFGAGMLLSVVFFRRKYWPAIFGTGMGLGSAYADCQDAINHPDKVQAYRVRAKDVRQLQNLKLKTLSHEPQQQQEAASPPPGAASVQQLRASYAEYSPQQQQPSPPAYDSYQQLPSAPTYDNYQQQQQQIQQQYWPQQATPTYQEPTFTPPQIDPVELQKQYDFYSAHQQYYHNQQGFDQQQQQSDGSSGYEQYQYPTQ